MKVVPFGMKRAMASLRVETSNVISSFARGFTQRFPFVALADYAGREAQISALEASY